MKSLSDLLNKTPWWALVVTAFACLIALAAFITPYHIIDYRGEGASPEERRAIKREIDNAFAENAIDIAHGVIRGMRRNTKDPERKAELEEALRGLEEARQELRDAGAEVARAKREALEQSRDASRAAIERLAEAKREVENAMSKGGAENAEARRALDEALKAAAEAQKRVEADVATAKPRKRIRIGMSGDSDKPLVDVDVGEPEPGEKPGLTINPNGRIVPAKPGVALDPKTGLPVPPAIPAPPGPLASAIPAPPAPPAVDPLPPEFRNQIRQNVTGDMYRIGIGAALALILLPMFVLALIAKFFIDRSRAATRMADLKRKEAEHHRMSRQLTEAKLQALQAQVEPHFLYNTLASVQALTEVDPAQANAMTGHLIQYLRNALPKMREGISTVGQEIELVRAYLSILQMRMGKRLAFEIDVPENVNAVAFPPLMLPSLVENAIKHGLEPQREGGTVRIGAELLDGRLRLTVADTGRGFGETIGAGVGLANIRERLAALYGDTARLTLVENTPHGVVATIDVPADAARASSAAQAAQATTEATKEAAAPKPELSVQRTRSARFLAVLSSVERFWRKTLIYLFFGLVILAAVLSLFGIVGVATDAFPVQIEDQIFSGPGSTLVGTAAIMLAFVCVVLAIAIVVAVIYGLGFLFVALAVLMSLVFLAAVSPVLAPILVVGFLIWWFVRKKEPKPVERVEPAL